MAKKLLMIIKMIKRVNFKIFTNRLVQSLAKIMLKSWKNNSINLLIFLLLKLARLEIKSSIIKENYLEKLIRNQH